MIFALKPLLRIAATVMPAIIIAATKMAILVMMFGL